jgi:hypothetical protein
MARCEGCYIEVPDDRRRCDPCWHEYGHAIASGIVYTVTYFGALGLFAVGAWLSGLLVAAVGGFAFWRARRRMREIRLLAATGFLPRATIKHD